MLKEAVETSDKKLSNDIETDFINYAIKNSKALTVFLVNGIKLEGKNSRNLYLIKNLLKTKIINANIEIKGPTE